MQSLMRAVVALTLTIAWSLPAGASVVSGELFGVFSGNDNVAGIAEHLGFDVTMLAKIDTPSSVGRPSLSVDGLTIDSFSVDEGEVRAGQWSYDGPGIASIIVLKAGPRYAVYLFNNEITGNMPNIGLWDTGALDNKGLSHITAYSSVVPIPGAIWLMVSALAGLAATRRRS